MPRTKTVKPVKPVSTKGVKIKLDMAPAPTQMTMVEPSKDGSFDFGKPAHKQPCPSCGTTDTSKLKANPHGGYLWGCCYQLCTKCSPPHLVKKSSVCKGCNSHTTCHCETECSDCGEDDGKPVCHNCDSCKGCCNCVTCTTCKANFYDDDSCPKCTLCPDCDDCPVCEGCDSKDDIQECGFCEGCCDCAEEDGGSEHGEDVEDVPWAAGSYKMSNVLPDGYWKKWDPVQAMADFYVLSYMDTTPPVGAPDERVALAAIADIAKAVREHLVEEFDPVFVQYVDMIVGGEVRHHKQAKALKGERTHAWWRWPAIRAQYGDKVLLDAARMFDTMGGGIGGPPWASAARLLHARITGKIPAWCFVDRVFSMEHHNGSLFNKVPWKKGDTPLDLGTHGMQVLGKAHSRDRPDLELLLLMASPEVQQLFYQWWKAHNRALISGNHRPLQFPRPKIQWAKRRVTTPTGMWDLRWDWVQNHKPGSPYTPKPKQATGKFSTALDEISSSGFATSNTTKYGGSFTLSDIYTAGVAT